MTKKTKIIGGIVLGALVLGGVGYYMATKSDRQKAQNQANLDAVTTNPYA